MFGPNVRPQWSHRDELYERLHERICEQVRNCLGLTPDWWVLIVPGSGTLALEMLIWSFQNSLTPLFDQSGKFGRRLWDLCFAHDKLGIGTEDVIYTQYETSTASYNQSGWKAKGLTIVDAISAAPFYRIPFDADIVVTVSGKQLRAPAGLAFICIKPSVAQTLHNHFKWDWTCESYINLSRWCHYSACNQMPITAPISLMQSTESCLDKYNRLQEVAKIEKRRAELIDAVAQTDVAVSGEGPTAILTGLNADFAQRWGLYKGWSPPSNVRGFSFWQVFLWSGSDRHFEQFLMEMYACHTTTRSYSAAE